MLWRFRVRPGVLALVGLGLVLGPRDARAEDPWSYELSATTQRELIDEAGAGEQLSETEQAGLELAIAQGMLLASATCESSGTIRELSPGSSIGSWIGDVENTATVLVSNLSDHTVWLVDASISPIDDVPELSRDPLQPLGSWAANLPFIPPHSQARILMGCNTLTAIGGQSFDKIDATGTAGAMTPALARKLATTRARFHHELGWDKTVTAREPEARSLASYALPWVDDRESARMLLQAIRKHGDEYMEGDEPLDRSSPWRLGLDLARAPLATAHGIVDVIEDDPPEALAELLRAAIRERSGDNDEALLRLSASVCARAEPETVDALLIAELKSKRARAWTQGFIQACPLAPERSMGVVEALAADAKGRSSTRPSGLTRFIALMPSPNFELAMSMLMRADPAAIEAELAALLDPTLRPEPEPLAEPELEAAQPELEAAEPAYLPRVIDGGERAVVLWIAMASLPPPERLAVLESYVRPQDAAEVLALLIPWRMNKERFAVFDRVAAKLDALPAKARGDGLEPVMRAGLDSPWLERELLDRLFRLAEHDRARLRPIALEALAKNQPVFTTQAIAALPMDHGELLDLFQGSLRECGEPLHVRDCYEALAADPRLLSAAESGLSAKLLAKLTQSLKQPDPNQVQRELLGLYLPLGVDIDPIATTTCERAKQLAAFEGEVDEHLAFLAEYAPDHACTAELHEQLGAEEKLTKIFVGGVLGVLALIGLGVLASRRRQARLLAESER